MDHNGPPPVDRVVLALASGPLGQFVGTVLELTAIGVTALRVRVDHRRRRD